MVARKIDIHQIKTLDENGVKRVEFTGILDNSAESHFSQLSFMMMNYQAAELVFDFSSVIKVTARILNVISGLAKKLAETGARLVIKTADPILMKRYQEVCQKENEDKEEVSDFIDEEEAVRSMDQACFCF